MTRSIGIADRIRWMTALLGSAAVVIALAAIHANRGQLPSLQLSTPAPAGSSAPLDPRIAGLAAHHPGDVVEAIVQFKAGVGLDRARWDVARAQGKVFGQLHIINALAVRLTAQDARLLSGNADVHAVSLNGVVTVQGMPFDSRFGDGHGHGDRHGHGHGFGTGSGDGAPSTSNLQTTYDETLNVLPAWRDGITGAGVGVAVIDTGIDGGLPDFQGSAGQGSRVVETAVTNPNATSAIDDYGHGTMVAGVIAGNGDNLDPSDPLRGQYVGVAPGADLISIKASDDYGKATVLDVIYGLQFAVDHRSDFNIRVVNLSLDSQTPQSYTTDPLDAAVESAWLHGIVVVAAAGNRGDTPGAVQYAPANDPYAITVGGVDEHGSANPADDTIASWSSQGTTQDGFHKPDVYAPGAHIISVLAPNSAFAHWCPSCTIGGEYIRASGTSLASPMIAGVVADLLQAHPDWTPDQVKGALTDPSVASNPALKEVDAEKALSLQDPAPADGGLTPNKLIDPSTGDINYSLSSWSQSSWSRATGQLAAPFAMSSWSCTCGASDSDGVGPSASSWSASSWSASSWSTYFDSSSNEG